MFDYSEFKRLYDAADSTAEFYVSFGDKEAEYMIIKYDDGPTFQRCGRENRSGEEKFACLDVLYESDLVDGINLKRDWHKVSHVYPNGYGTFEDYCSFFGIEYKGELENDYE